LEHFIVAETGYAFVEHTSVISCFYLNFSSLFLKSFLLW